MANAQAKDADITENHKPTGRLFCTTGQLNLVHATPTKVLLDTLDADFTDGIEDAVNSKITPGIAGYYHIIGQVYFESMVADKAYGSIIYIDGVAKRWSVKDGGISAIRNSVLVMDYFKLSATNYIELWAISYAGDDTVDISGGSHRTWLSVQRQR